MSAKKKKKQPVVLDIPTQLRASILSILRTVPPGEYLCAKRFYSKLTEKGFARPLSSHVLQGGRKRPNKVKFSALMLAVGAIPVVFDGEVLGYRLPDCIFAFAVGHAMLLVKLAAAVLFETTLTAHTQHSSSLEYQRRLHSKL